MKIERLSENQIRCTLNKADLNEKNLKLSELAYGSQKARDLFRDMIQQASAELGFEIDDTPLMVEAIPVSPDCLILIVTKVEDPEELDTRFSRFTKVNEYDVDDEDDDYDDLDEGYDYDDDDDFDDTDDNGTIARIQISGSENVPDEIKRALEGIFKNLPGISSASIDASFKKEVHETTNRTDKDSDSSEVTDTDENTDELPKVQALYSFDSLSTIIRASKQIASFYFSDNCLYKNPANNRYYLLVSNSSNSAHELARVCSIIGEYGTMEEMTYAMPAHLKEHYIPIVTEDAVQTLSAL